MRSCRASDLSFRYITYMAARLGVVIYWFGVLLAFLLGAIGVFVLFGDQPIVSVVLFVPAAIVWLVGRALLYILAGE